jgi:predicted component of type VI protein secretion system
MALSLEIVEGLDAGRRVELTGPLEIGRGPQAGLQLGDPQVSRSHARVVPDQTGAVVTDLGSSNGTFVNGHQLFGPARLEAADHLLVGSTVLELRTAEQVARRPSAAIQVPPALATPARTPDYVPPEVLDQLAQPPDGEPAPPTPGPRRAAGRDHPLDPLLDVRAKRKARTAPLAMFVLVVLALLVFLATR